MTADPNKNMYNVRNLGLFNCTVRDHIRIEQDYVCCGLARIYGIRCTPYDRQALVQTAIWRHDLSKEAAEAHVDANVGTLVDADGMYELMYKEVERTWYESRVFMLSDNVCVHAGVYNGSYNEDEVSTFKFTEWLKKNNKGIIIEGPVTYNQNENSYVQMRFWIPPWAEDNTHFPDMASYLAAEKAGIAWRDEDDDYYEEDYYDEDED